MSYSLSPRTTHPLARRQQLPQKIQSSCANDQPGFPPRHCYNPTPSPDGKSRPAKPARQTRGLSCCRFPWRRAGWPPLWSRAAADERDGPSAVSSSRGKWWRDRSRRRISCRWNIRRTPCDHRHLCATQTHSKKPHSGRGYSTPGIPGKNPNKQQTCV